MNDDLMETRRNMAAVFRWSSRLGLSEGICNHYSYAIDENRFLVNPQGIHWSELRATDLLTVDHDGQVIEGQECVDKIANAPVTSSGRGELSVPTETVTILGVDIEEIEQ